MYLQYYVIKLSMFQAGIDTMTSYLALVAAIWLFQNYLLGVNWRVTQWGSAFVSILFGMVLVFAVGLRADLKTRRMVRRYREALGQDWQPGRTNDSQGEP